jgi:phosphotransferase system enzyme I (PtsI)
MSIVLHGFTAGKGIAIGRAHLILRGMTEVPQYNIIADELAAETTRLTTPSRPAAASSSSSEAPFPKTPPPNWARLSRCT